MPNSKKTVLITGASSGFGEALSHEFAKNDFNLVLGARRTDRLDRLASELSGQYGSTVLHHALDVQSNESSQTFCALALERFPQIDVLINNAGLALGKEPVKNADLSDWVTMYETNVMGVLRMTQAILPSMEKAQAGHIINVGSVAGRESYIGGGGYCGSKHALKALTKTLRQEILGQNIRVSCIDPGLAETEFSLVRFKGDQTKADATYTGMTALCAKDIAEIVYFIASRPAHVNIDELLVLPTAQASSTQVSRSAKDLPS